MSGSWKSLPTHWNLEDVQAGLNVCITSLSFLASFLCVRYCWQRAASRVVRGESVPLTSLLTVSNLGEIGDAIQLFWKKIACAQFIGLWLQCLIIGSLSAVAIFSGPIARYATRRGMIIVPVSNTVSTITHDISDYISDFARMNATWIRLDNASFPTDQFLDFLPDTTVDWVYNPDQWQNRWLLNCTSSQQLYSSIRASENNCSRLLDQFPGVRQLRDFPYKDFDTNYQSVKKKNNSMEYALMGGFGRNVTKRNQVNNSIELSLGFSATIIRGLDIKNTTNSSCRVGEGGIYNVSQVILSCQARRRDSKNNSLPFSHPQGIKPSDITGRFVDYFYPDFQSQVANKIPTNLPTTHQLLRFLQLYTILWETQVFGTRSHIIDSRVPVVQISVAFTTIAAMFAGLVVCGLTYCLFFGWRYRQFLSTVPLSKLDWMIQSIEAEDRPRFDSEGRQRWTVTIEKSALAQGMPHDKRRRMEFTAATYSNRETSTWFLEPIAQSAVSHNDSLLSLRSDLSGSTIQNSKGQSGRRVGFKDSATAGAIHPLRKLAGYKILKEDSNDG